MNTIREVNKELRRQNKLYPEQLVFIEPSQWPESVRNRGNLPMAVMRSRDFLVTVWTVNDPAVAVRLSILRTEINATGRWKDGISWEELQRLKHEAGYGFHHAVEIYPPDDDVVNVANMRHLWIMTDPLTFAWRATT